MDIYDYTTRGGKNVITNYIDKLSAKERLEIYDIRQEIRKHGMDAFEKRKSGEARDKKSIGTCKTGKSNLRGDWNVGEK